MITLYGIRANKNAVEQHLQEALGVEQGIPIPLSKPLLSLPMGMVIRYPKRYAEGYVECSQEQ